MLTRVVIVVGAMLGALLVSTGPAAAEPVRICDAFGKCRIVIENPGTPPGTAPGTPPGGGGGEYQRPPQPSPGHVWSPECGMWYLPGTIPCAIAPPGTPGGPVVTPAQLAEQAVAQLQLSAPEIGIVPQMGPGRMGYVGAPVWMWTPEEQWDPLTATATAGGMMVTAVAQLVEVEWDMGDGTTVTCDTPGWEYKPGYGNRMSPDCGHRYQKTSGDQPNDEYTVEATAHWEVTWSGATSGAQQATMSSTTPLRIGEIQVIVEG